MTFLIIVWKQFIFIGAVFPLYITEARNVPNLKHINQTSVNEVHKEIVTSNGSLIDGDAPNLGILSEIKSNRTWKPNEKINLVASMKAERDLGYTHETTSEQSKPLIVDRPIAFFEEKDNSSEETVFSNMSKEHNSKETPVNVLCNLRNSSLLLDRKLCVNTTLQKRQENNSTSPSTRDVGEKKELKWKYAKANGVVRLRNLTRLSNKASDGSILTNGKTRQKIPYPIYYETNVLENEQIRDVINNNTKPLKAGILIKNGSASLSRGPTTQDGSSETTTDHLWPPFQSVVSSQPDVVPPLLQASDPISGISNNSFSQLHPKQLPSKEISAPGLNINMSKPDLPELIPTTEQNLIKQDNGGKGKAIKSSNITGSHAFSDIYKESVDLSSFLPSMREDFTIEPPPKFPERRSTIEPHTTGVQYERMLEMLKNGGQNNLFTNLSQEIELNVTKKALGSEPGISSGRKMNYKSFIPEFTRRNGKQYYCFP